MASVATTTTNDQQEPEDNAGYRTPTKEKRKSPDDFYTEVGRTPKKVSFGPDLNPEIFSKNNPPNTPVKRGEHQPLTASTPSFMAKLAAAGGTPKSILTPSRSSRTNVFHGLEKPTPLKFKLFSPELQKTVTTPKNQASVEKDTPSSANRKPASEQDENVSDGNSGNDSDDSLREKIGSTSTVSPFIVPTTAIESENFKSDVEEEDDDDESPPPTPTRTPTARQPSDGLSTPSCSRLQLSNQDIPEEHLHHSFKLHASPLQPDSDNPFISRKESHGDSPSHSPTIAAVQRHHPDMTDAIEEELDTPLIAETELPAETEAETATPNVDIPDTTPVHTPIRNRAKDDQKSKVTPGRNTPGSASRLALLQLSAQKIRGLPDLLQSTSSTTFARESTETTPAVPKSSTDEVESSQESSADEEVTPVAPKADNNVATEQAEEKTTLLVLESGSEMTDDQTEDEDKEEEEENQISEPVVEDDNESVGDEAELEADDVLAKDHAQNSRVWPSIGADSKRRMSAPAASTVLRPQSPIFNGLRGVFRTPQKVVETCFAGFTGFRNFVMTPTRSPKQPSKELFASLPKSESQSAEGDENPFQVKSNDTKEVEAVETLDVQEIITTTGSVQHGPELSEFTFSIGVGEQKISAGDSADQSTDEKETATNARKSILPTSTATTPKRRISSHKDALALLTGHSGELSPKSKEFTFATDSLEQIKARGRRSDVFPQKRTVAKRGLSQSGDKEETKNETDDKDGSNKRRRTISMFEFMAAVSSSTTTTPITATVTRSSVDVDVEFKEQHDGAGDGDDAEQAELLRLLGEGADSGEDDEDSASEGVEASEDASYDYVSHGGIDENASNGTDEALLEATVKVSPRRKSESLRSNGSTPTKRQQSFRSRLGSSSPGFGLYEGDDDEDDDEEDEVMMISPKRIRVLE